MRTATSLFFLWLLVASWTAVHAAQSFEDYLRASAVPRTVIERFLKGPSWAKFDPDTGYTLGNYLPSDGMDHSTTISTTQPNGARQSFVYAGRPCRINT